MLISACVITKNGAEYLKQSIESYIDFVDELIVIDDHSTDGTQDIVASFPKARLYSGTYNGNKSHQRQEYIKKAKGQWIFCPDDDEVYSEQDMKFLHSFALNPQGNITIKTTFNHFWKDYIHTINGSNWDCWLQRFYKNIPGMGYWVCHHSVSMPDGKLLSSIAIRDNKVLHKPDFKVFHYSYCKKSDHIRRKIEYYMHRDNPNCYNNKEKAKEFANRHPYFSGKLEQPRFGEDGLFICGYVQEWKDKVERHAYKHPLSMTNHPLYQRYYTYALKMNEYMEKHWQFNNHLSYPHHQMRLKHTALQCIGKTLEVGCANGDSTGYFQHFNKDATFSGAEPSDWGFKEATRNHVGMQFYNDYAENLSVEDKSFDTVLLSEMIEHVLDTKPVLDEAFRVAKKRVVITTPAKPHPDPDHKRVITPDAMRELLKPYSDRVMIGGLTFEGWQTDPKVATSEDKIHFMIVVADVA